ncbi:hypothetical protein P3L10_027743 [Capsicum annuum]
MNQLTLKSQLETMHVMLDVLLDIVPNFSSNMELNPKRPPDDLYNVYSIMKTSKELWNALEKKYKTKDAGTKKFYVARFLEYKMIDNKTVVSQVQELQVIIQDLLVEGRNLMNTLFEHVKNVLNVHINFVVGLVMNEEFQVPVRIEKLSLLWKDFKNYLKHKRKEMTVKDLIVRLRIEEDNKATERRSKGNSSMN